MFSRSIIYLTFILTVLIVACQKEPVIPSPVNPPSKLLYPSSIYFLKQPKGLSTSDRIVYYLDYNDQNKISKLTVKLLRPDSDYSVTKKRVNFIYDSSGKLSQLQTYGSPFTHIGMVEYPGGPPFTSFVTTKITYSSQRVDIARVDSLSSKPVYYIKYDQNGNIIERSTNNYGTAVYKLKVDQDGRVSTYVYEEMTGGIVAYTQSSASYNVVLNYSTIPHPFVNVPELRIYSMIDDEYAFLDYQEEIMLQNKYCLSSVTNGIMQDYQRANINKSPTSYSYELNSYGYPTMLTSSIKNYNGVFEAYRKFEVTYIIR